MEHIYIVLCNGEFYVSVAFTTPELAQDFIDNEVLETNIPKNAWTIQVLDIK